MPQGQIEKNKDGLFTSKVNAIANGKTTCLRFRLPKGKIWYTNAYKDDAKDRKRVRASRTDGSGSSVYFKPHTLVIVE
jgi:hypothetical protein